jgi:hypothetical protein
MGPHRTYRFAPKLLLTITCCAVTFYSQTAVKSEINIEATGRLEFQEGRGYFVQVDSKRFPENKNRVWLMIPEDKVLLRRIDALLCKQVTVRGGLEQLPENVRAAPPPLGMFLTRFDIEEVSSVASPPKCSYLAAWFTPINDPNKPDWEILPQEAKAGEVILSKRNELGVCRTLRRRRLR